MRGLRGLVLRGDERVGHQGPTALGLQPPRHAVVPSDRGPGRSGEDHSEERDS